MTEPHVRLVPAGGGRGAVSTALPVIDHLLGVLADAGGFRLAIDSPPGTASAADEMESVGRGVGRALAGLLRRGTVASATAPADEALAQVAFEVGGRAALYDNVDLAVGGLETDVVARLLEGIAGEAGLTLHVRLLEGEDAGHVLEAIFKALGLALAQAIDEPGG